MVKKLKEYKIQNENKDSWKKLRVAVYTRVSTNDQYLNWVWLESQYGEIKRIQTRKMICQRYESFDPVADHCFNLSEGLADYSTRSADWKGNTA